MNEIKCQLFKVESRMNNFTLYRPSFPMNYFIQGENEGLGKYQLDAYTYDNFPIFWYYNSYRERPLFPYELIIKDYDRIKDGRPSFIEDFIDDLFSEEEARTLLTYLNQAENVTATMTDVELPVENNYASVRLWDQEPGVYLDDLRLVELPSQNVYRMPLLDFWFLPFLHYDLSFDVTYYFYLPSACDKGAILKKHIQKRLLTDINEVKEFENSKTEWIKEIRAEVKQMQMG